MNPKTWQWDWLGWQVFAPIVLPIAISSGVVSLWQTGESSFAIDWSIVFDDMSPWAICLYCVTLVCVTMHDFWPRLPSHPVLGAGLILAAFSVAVYASFIVIWRHDAKFHVGTKLWQMAFIFLIAVVFLCHSAVANGKKVRRNEAV